MLSYKTQVFPQVRFEYLHMRRYYLITETIWTTYVQPSFWVLMLLLVCHNFESQVVSTSHRSRIKPRITCFIDGDPGK
jgi:hypothetical protein